MTGSPTPYDTGARAEPRVWSLLHGEADRYGRVDFEDSNSDTICTIWVEGTEDGESVIHIQNFGMGNITRIVFDPDGEDAQPEFVIASQSETQRECSRCGDEVDILNSDDECLGCEEERARGDVCSRCDETIDWSTDMHAYKSAKKQKPVCGSCHHNARRSG